MAGECLPQAFHFLLLQSTLYIELNNLSVLLKALTSLMIPLKLFTANAIVIVMLILKENLSHFLNPGHKNMSSSAL